MKRSLFAFVLAIAGMLAAFTAAVHVRRLLEPSYHIDWPLFGSVVLVAMGVGLAMPWRLVAQSEFASSMLSPRPRIQLVCLVISIVTAFSAAIAASATTGFTPNWPHWDVPIASQSGVKELFGIWASAFTQEALYRFVILGTAIACCRSTLLGLLVSTLIFTLAHSNADHFYIAAGGLWFGAIALSTRSIWPAVAAHFGTNVVVTMLFRSSPLAHPTLLDATQSPPYNVAFAAMALAMSAYLLWPILKEDAAVRFIAAAFARLRRTGHRVVALPS